MGPKKPRTCNKIQQNMESQRETKGALAQEHIDQEAGLLKRTRWPGKRWDFRKLGRSWWVRKEGCWEERRSCSAWEIKCSFHSKHAFSSQTWVQLCRSWVNIVGDVNKNGFYVEGHVVSPGRFRWPTGSQFHRFTWDFYISDSLSSVAIEKVYLSAFTAQCLFFALN